MLLRGIAPPEVSRATSVPQANAVGRVLYDTSQALPCQCRAGCW